MTARTGGRGGAHGFSVRERPNDASLRVCPATIGREREKGRGGSREAERKEEEPYYRVDVVGEPACPGRPPGDSPGPSGDTGDGNGVAAVRARQQQLWRRARTYRTLPSSVTSLLNLSKAPN